LVLAACCLGAVAAAACDEGGSDKGGDPCAEAAAIRNEAVTAFCTDKADDCCFCQCFEDFEGLFDAGALYPGGVCECAIAGGAPSACEGAALDDARHCLGDEDSCAAVAVSVAESRCDASLLPEPG
jgi:hypothetical protein